MTPPSFVTLGLFIVDEFEYHDENGGPTERNPISQIGGGGTYAVIGARMWLPAEDVGMIVDKGVDFPSTIYSELLEYGSKMWLFRDQQEALTTRALNSYRGDHRSFKYLTPRIRLTPRDIRGTRLAKPEFLHFICSPSRALEILAEVKETNDWAPTTLYEPIPDRCVPEQLPSLIQVLPLISILSPNAEEGLSLLSLPLPPTKLLIEQAAQKFLDFGIGVDGKGAIIIRSGALGSFIQTREGGGVWVDPFHGGTDAKVVDVTGAGNSFLGGLAAGLKLTGGDVYEAMLYASVSASLTIEQMGLPVLTDPTDSHWNGDSPQQRLEVMRARRGEK